MCWRGKITRNAEIRIVRDGIIIADEHLTSLKRFKDDVKEVAKGYECGMGIEKFNDLKVGDIFEAYTIEEIPRLAGGRLSLHAIRAVD